MMPRSPIAWIVVFLSLLLSGQAPARGLFPELVPGAPMEAGASPADAGLKTSVKGAKTTSSCVPAATTLCLNEARFSVEVTWTDFEMNTGLGTAASLQVENSGLFWFFDDDNWEILVKILDGCGTNDHFWVYSAASTNVEYSLRITDHRTGIVKEYHNPLGHASAAVTDSLAFPTCKFSHHTTNVFLFANPSTLRTGESARITVIAREGDGQAPRGPQRVRLVADLGTIASEVLTNDLGEAEAIYTAGAVPGRGLVSAFLGDSPPASVDLTIREPENTELLLFANPTILPANGASTITVIARDANQVPLHAGERIRLIADMGEIEPEVFTDANGEAEVTFHAGSRPGAARITAILSGTHSESIGLDLLQVPDFIFLHADRSVIHRGSDQTIQLQARVFDTVGDPMHDVFVAFDSSLGILEPSAAFTDFQGVARVTLVVRAPELEHIPEGGSFSVAALVSKEGVALSDTFSIFVQ